VFLSAALPEPWVHSTSPVGHPPVRAWHPANLRVQPAAAFRSSPACKPITAGNASTSGSPALKLTERFEAVLAWRPCR